MPHEEANRSIDINQSEIQKQQSSAEAPQELKAKLMGKSEVFIKKVDEFQQADSRYGLKSPEAKQILDAGLADVNNYLREVAAKGKSILDRRSKAGTKEETAQQLSEEDQNALFHIEGLGSSVDSTINEYRNNLEKIAKVEPVYQDTEKSVQALNDKEKDQKFLDLAYTNPEEFLKEYHATVENVAKLQRTIYANDSLPKGYLEGIGKIENQTLAEINDRLKTQIIIGEQNRLIKANYGKFVRLLPPAKFGDKPTIDITDEGKKLPEPELMRILMALQGVEVIVDEQLRFLSASEKLQPFFAAKALFEGGKLEEAAQIFKQFLEKGSKNLTGSEAERALSYQKEAEAYLKQIEQNKEINTAKTLLESGNWVEAKKLLNKFIKEKGKEEGALIDLAEQYLTLIAKTQFEEILLRFRAKKEPQKMIQTVAASQYTQAQFEENPDWIKWKKCTDAIKQIETEFETGTVLNFDTVYKKYLSNLSMDFEGGKELSDAYNDQVQIEVMGREGYAVLARKYRSEGKYDLAEKYFGMYFQDKLNKLGQKEVTFESVKRKYGGTLKSTLVANEQMEAYKAQYDKDCEKDPNYAKTHPWNEKAVFAQLENSYLHEMWRQELTMAQNNKLQIGTDSSAWLTLQDQPVWNEYMAMKGERFAGAAWYQGRISDETRDQIIKELVINVPIILASAAISGGIGGLVASGIRGATTEGAMIYARGATLLAAEGAGFAAETAAFVASEQLLTYAATGESKYADINPEDGMAAYAERFGEEWWNTAKMFGVFKLAGATAQSLSIARDAGTLNPKFAEVINKSFATGSEITAMGIANGGTLSIHDFVMMGGMHMSGKFKKHVEERIASGKEAKTTEISDADIEVIEGAPIGKTEQARFSPPPAPKRAGKGADVIPIESARRARSRSDVSEARLAVGAEDLSVSRMPQRPDLKVVEGGRRTARIPESRRAEAADIFAEKMNVRLQVLRSRMIEVFGAEAVPPTKFAQFSSKVEAMVRDAAQRGELPDSPAVRKAIIELGESMFGDLTPSQATKLESGATRATRGMSASFEGAIPKEGSGASEAAPDSGVRLRPGARSALHDLPPLEARRVTLGPPEARRAMEAVADRLPGFEPLQKHAVKTALIEIARGYKLSATDVASIETALGKFPSLKKLNGAALQEAVIKFVENKYLAEKGIKLIEANDVTQVLDEWLVEEPVNLSEADLVELPSSSRAESVKRQPPPPPERRVSDEQLAEQALYSAFEQLGIPREEAALPSPEQARRKAPTIEELSSSALELVVETTPTRTPEAAKYRGLLEPAAEILASIERTTAGEFFSRINQGFGRDFMRTLDLRMRQDLLVAQNEGRPYSPEATKARAIGLAVEMLVEPAKFGLKDAPLIQEGLAERLIADINPENADLWTKTARARVAGKFSAEFADSTRAALTEKAGNRPSLRAQVDRMVAEAQAFVESISAAQIRAGKRMPLTDINDLFHQKMSELIAENKLLSPEYKKQLAEPMESLARERKITMPEVPVDLTSEAALILEPPTPPSARALMEVESAPAERPESPSQRVRRELEAYTADLYENMIYQANLEGSTTTRILLKNIIEQATRSVLERNAKTGFHLLGENGLQSQILAEVRGRIQSGKDTNIQKVAPDLLAVIHIERTIIGERALEAPKAPAPPQQITSAEITYIDTPRPEAPSAKQKVSTIKAQEITTDFGDEIISRLPKGEKIPPSLRNEIGIILKASKAGVDKLVAEQARKGNKYTEQQIQSMLYSEARLRLQQRFGRTNELFVRLSVEALEPVRNKYELQRLPEASQQQAATPQKRAKSSSPEKPTKVREIAERAREKAKARVDFEREAREQLEDSLNESTREMQAEGRPQVEIDQIIKASREAGEAELQRTLARYDRGRLMPDSVTKYLSSLAEYFSRIKGSISSKINKSNPQNESNGSSLAA